MSAVLIGQDAHPSLSLAARFLFASGWKERDNERPWRRRFPKSATARQLPAVPASLAGCVCHAQGAGFFHLAGARNKPCEAVGKLGRKSVPVSRLHSTLPPSWWQPQPDLPRASRSWSHRFPAVPGGRRRSAPGLLLRPLLLQSKPDPPHKPGGRELVLGETPPPRLEEDFLSHIQFIDFTV